MASEDLKISKQGTAGKMKHRTLMIPHDLATVRRFESGER
jgi:hypothetical protein